MARFKRASGVLLHPTALSGPYGIGTLGLHAVAFLDWLKSAGQSYWQICPLVPTGYGDSPYQGFSAFAGNPNLIDLEELLAIGLLNEEDVADLSRLPDDHVDFGKLIPFKASRIGHRLEEI
jgi:4-alpha-glucanotransferase